MESDPVSVYGVGRRAGGDPAVGADEGRVLQPSALPQPRLVELAEAEVEEERGDEGDDHDDGKEPEEAPGGDSRKSELLPLIPPRRRR